MSSVFGLCSKNELDCCWQQKMAAICWKEGKIMLVHLLNCYWIIKNSLQSSKRDIYPSACYREVLRGGGVWRKHTDNIFGKCDHHRVCCPWLPSPLRCIYFFFFFLPFLPFLKFPDRVTPKCFNTRRVQDYANTLCWKLWQQTWVKHFFFLRS